MGCRCASFSRRAKGSVMATLVHVVFVGVIFWSTVCRARHMDDCTLPEVRWQHGLLNAFALASLVFSEWAAPLLAAGASIFLLLGSHRWRHDAPAGTRMQPAPQPPKASWLPSQE